MFATMKLFRNNKLIFLLIYFISLQASQAKGQTSDSKCFWQVKIAGWPEYITKQRVLNPAHAEIQFNRRINSIFSSGAAVAYYNSNFISPTVFLNTSAVVHLHFMPVMGFKEKYRLDPYFSGKVGLKKYYKSDSSKDLISRFYIGLGCAYYPFDQLGVFYEYGYDRPFNTSIKLKYYSEMKLGLSVKF